MFEALILGAIQGLTEFLPISSSAHIRIVGAFMPNALDPGAAFTAITQIGTEIAVLIYFRKDITEIASSWLKNIFARFTKEHLSPDEYAKARLGWLIIVGTLPIVFMGYIGQDFITNNLRSLWIISATLIIFGLILGFADYVGNRDKVLSELTTSHGLLYGIAQTLALVPGVSRSGATIAMGRLLGYKREAALRYSFLLALPAVFGSGLYELKKSLSDQSVNVYSLPEIFVATLTAFVIGFAVIAWLMKFISKKSFMPFIIYRVSLGTVLLALLATGVINP